MKKRDIIIVAGILYIGKFIVDSVFELLSATAIHELRDEASNGDKDAQYLCKIFKIGYKREPEAKQQIGFHA